MKTFYKTLFSASILSLTLSYADESQLKERVNSKPFSLEERALILEQLEKEQNEHQSNASNEELTETDSTISAKKVKGCGCGTKTKKDGPSKKELAKRIKQKAKEDTEKAKEDKSTQEEVVKVADSQEQISQESAPNENPWLSKKAKGCSSCKKKKARAGAWFSADPKVYLPQDGHYLINASTQRKAITLEDGTVWKVRNSDLWKLLNWKSNDFLFITQNNSWFSSFQYQIINHVSHESIEVYLYEGPVINGEHTNYIFAMDLDVGEIVFDNNACWKLCEADYSIYQKWGVNDPIIIGINTGWRSEYTHILINVNKPEYCVRAKPF